VDGKAVKSPVDIDALPFGVYSPAVSGAMSSSSFIFASYFLWFRFGLHFNEYHNI
jgi:hypothetical protein